MKKVLRKSSGGVGLRRQPNDTMTASAYSSKESALMLEVAPLVIHEMRQLNLVKQFIADESARAEIIEVCLKETCRKWDKMAVLTRTNPSFMLEMARFIGAA